MTGHALPRIYTAPKQQPADTTHRPPISTHTLAIGTRPPPAPPVPSGLCGAWAQLGVASVYSRAGLAGCGAGCGKSGRENTPPSPEARRGVLIYSPVG